MLQVELGGVVGVQSRRDGVAGLRTSVMRVADGGCNSGLWPRIRLRL